MTTLACAALQFPCKFTNFTNLQLLGNFQRILQMPKDISPHSAALLIKPGYSSVSVRSGVGGKASSTGAGDGKSFKKKLQ